ncbi:Uncharacterised protein [Bordetella pertussis]|nr:Uncharacterised protein [Bordetella pertussis]
MSWSSTKMLFSLIRMDRLPGRLVHALRAARGRRMDPSILAPRSRASARRAQNSSRKRMRNRRPLILLLDRRAKACLATWRSSAT